MAELIRCRNVHTGAFATLNKDALRFFPDYVAYDGPDPDEIDESAGGSSTFADLTAAGGSTDDTNDADDSANKKRSKP
jgi:hypothetical protein